MPVFRAFPDLPLAELGLIIALAQHSRQPSHFVFFLGHAPPSPIGFGGSPGHPLLCSPCCACVAYRCYPLSGEGVNWVKIDPQKFWCYCNYTSLRACLNALTCLYVEGAFFAISNPQIHTLSPKIRSPERHTPSGDFPYL